MQLLTGPDVSSYQTGISMKAVKAAGHSFVNCKATEGTGYTNPDFARQITTGKAAGLLASAYHFLTGGDGAAQAGHFLAVIDPYLAAGAVTVTADFEGEGASHQTLHGFCRAVEAAGYPAGVYTDVGYWQQYGSPSCGECAGRGLWLAGRPAMPATPAPWRTIGLWQFTNADTSVPGWTLDMSSCTDLAYFHAGLPAGPAPAPAAPAPAPAPAPAAPAFPLPRGFYFGPASGPAASVSGLYSHGADLERWQQQMGEVRKWRITADGRYGPQTAKVARDFQAEKGLPVDGLIGPVTWDAAWTAPVT